MRAHSSGRVGGRHPRAAWAWLIAVLFVPALAMGQTAERQILYGGWFDAPPYAFRSDGTERATGFDVEMLLEAGRRAGYRFVLERMDADYARQLMGEGEIDVWLSPTRLDEGRPYAMATAPFRRERIVLFLSSGARAALEGAAPESVEALFGAVAHLGLRIGVTTGAYYGPAAQVFIDDPANGPLLTPSATDADNAGLAEGGAIDGFLADRLTGYQALAQLWRGDLLTPWPEPVYERDVRFLFSSEAVTRQEVDRFDAGLRSVIDDHTAERLESQFVAPLLLSIAVSTSWFPLLDAIGTGAFAISGVLLARRERYSLLGAFVLAALPAVGGGVVRDLLVGRRPIGILADPTALTITVATVLASYLAFRVADMVRARMPPAGDGARFLPARSVYEISDAVGLAAFTVTGVVIAIRFDAEPLWLWGPLLAILTAAGGGILRDVVRSDPDIPTLKTSFYAEIALIWGLLLSLAAGLFGAHMEPASFQIFVIGALVGACATRLLVVALRVPGPRF